MQNFFTREDVLAYHQQGVQTIRLDSMPILTDLARETLQTLGMEIVTGAAPAAQPASRPAASRPAAAPSGGSSAVGGGYGSSAFAAPSGGPVTAQKLTAPGLNKPAFRDLICSDKKLMGTFIGTPHPVMTEFVGHFGFDFVCIDAEHNAMHLETVQKMLQSLKATPTYGMVRIPTLSYENVAGALDIGADALLIPQIRTMDDIRRLKDYSQYPPIGHRGSGPSRLWDYGDSIIQLATDQDINRTTNIVVQLETVQAVEHIDEIVQSDFIDMFFIGPGDLSMDMGIFAQFSNPRLTDTIMLLREKTARAGKRLGIFAGNFDAARNWYAKGFDMCIINSELALPWPVRWASSEASWRPGNETDPHLRRRSRPGAPGGDGAGDGTRGPADGPGPGAGPAPRQERTYTEAAPPSDHRPRNRPSDTQCRRSARHGG